MPEKILVGKMLGPKFFWENDILGSKNFRSEKYFIPLFSLSPKIVVQKNPFGPKQLFWSEKDKSTPRSQFLMVLSPSYQ